MSTASGLATTTVDVKSSKRRLRRTLARRISPSLMHAQLPVICAPGSMRAPARGRRVLARGRRGRGRRRPGRCSRDRYPRELSWLGYWQRCPEMPWVRVLCLRIHCQWLHRLRIYLLRIHCLRIICLRMLCLSRLACRWLLRWQSVALWSSASSGASLGRRPSTIGSGGYDLFSPVAPRVSHA